MLTGEALYGAHREATWEMLGQALPPWTVLGFESRAGWNERAYEQELRDRGTLTDPFREEQPLG